MPGIFIPGLGVGGVIVGPDGVAGGAIVNNAVIGGATLANHSGIGFSQAKLTGMPEGLKEVDGYRETFRNDDTHAVRVFDVPWGTRKSFVDWFLGFSTSVTLTIGGNRRGDLRREPPAQHPEFPWLYATECQLLMGQGAYRNNPHIILRRGGSGVFEDVPGRGVVDPNDPNVGLAIVNAQGQPILIPMIAYYDSSLGSDDYSARYAVTYRHLDYEIRTDTEAAALAVSNNTRAEAERYVSRNVSYAVQGIPVPSGQVKFTEGPAGVINQAIPDNAAVILLPTQEVTYVLRDWPDPPYTAFENCVGKVNAAAFDGARGHRSYPAETMLMQAPAIKRMRSIVGRVTWEITYKFLYRASGWNKYPAQGGFWAAAFPDGSKPYRSADFWTLFEPPEAQRYQ